MLHKYKDYTYSIEAVNLVSGESELRVLRDYQIGAIDFGLEHKTIFFAMDLGLGKTAVILKIIECLKKKAIVFAPLRVVYNTWPDEIHTWTPGLTYDIIHGLSKRNVFEKSKADILLINFDGLK